MVEGSNDEKNKDRYISAIIMAGAIKLINGTKIQKIISSKAASCILIDFSSFKSITLESAFFLALLTRNRIICLYDLITC